MSATDEIGIRVEAVFCRGNSNEAGVRSLQNAVQPGGGTRGGGAKEPGRDILGQGLWEQSPHSGRGKGAVLQRLGEEGTRPGGADALGRRVGASC